MKFSPLLAFLLAASIATSNAKFSDCQLKYTGNLAIGNVQVGTLGDYQALGRVSNGFKQTSFSFFECNIHGYYKYPEEHGFLVANTVDRSFVATAWTHSDDQSWATVEHLKGDYNGNDQDRINRQLVYANYYCPNGGPAQVDITFQGSPNSDTSTGFSLPHALFARSDAQYSKKGAVILDDNTNQLGYSKLSLHDIVIESADSLVKGQKTTNEQKILNDLNTNSFKLSPTTENKLKSEKKIF